MPTAHTVETIYNGALDIVGENPVASMLDNRKEVRWLNRNYTHYVQTALRRDVWNFAVEFHELNLEVAEPAFRWKYSYGLPNGWLRVLPITYRGERGGRPIAHEVKGNKVYSNEGSSFYAELIMDRQLPGEWDPLFANVVIARLALGMAHSITHKASFVDRAKQIADEAYDDASLINAFEGSPEPTEQHDIIRVRGL